MLEDLPKENNINRKEYIVIFSYALLVFFLISEPFVLQVTNKEQVRIYLYMLLLLGTIILARILRKTKGVKN